MKIDKNQYDFLKSTFNSLKLLSDDHQTYSDDQLKQFLQSNEELNNFLEN